MTWDIRGKRVLVTGATSGIGLESSAVMAKMGARVVLVGRDARKTEACAGEVKARSGNSDVEWLLCDFSKQASIRELADAYRRRFSELHVLVNNAGGVHKKREVTADGIEATWATNHLGYYLLTRLLLDVLRKSAPARIVNVASIAHRRATMDLDDPGFDRGGYQIMRAYGRSKLGNVLFTAELARRLSGTGVTVNCLHPGAVATNIWSGAPTWAKPALAVFGMLAFISVEDGAKTIVHLATTPELETVSGAYFEKNRSVRPATLAQDTGLAARLWDVSARMTGLSPELAVAS